MFINIYSINGMGAYDIHCKRRDHKRRDHKGRKAVGQTARLWTMGSLKRSNTRKYRVHLLLYQLSDSPVQS